MRHRIAVIREFISQLSDEQKAVLLQDNWLQHKCSINVVVLAYNMTDNQPMELIQNARIILRHVEKQENYE